MQYVLFISSSQSVRVPCATSLDKYSYQASQGLAHGGLGILSMGVLKCLERTESTLWFTGSETGKVDQKFRVLPLKLAKVSYKYANKKLMS